MAPPSTSSGSSASSLRNKPIDPVTRTALRYTISPREYEMLHHYLISRAPERVQRRTPDPKRFEKLTRSPNRSSNSSNGAGHVDTNEATVRAATRVFIAVYIGMKGWNTLMSKLAVRRGKQPVAGAKFGNSRVALSFSGIFLLHRLFHRFLRRLRTALLEENAAPFRDRNPRIASVLTSRFAPALGAAMSGFMLGVSPADQMRMSIAIYVFTRSLEFTYNALEESGTLWRSNEDGTSGRPWWFGSWMLMPFALGQLLHAFVFDRDCFPENFGKIILDRSPEYIQKRPAHYPASRPFPETFDIVDALGELSKLKWPTFASPILFPSAKQTLPASVSMIAPITSFAHPGIKNTSCALLHPHEPSCTTTYLNYWRKAFPTMLRFFALFYGAFALLAFKKSRKEPAKVLNNLSARIIQMSLFVTGAIGTSWSSICLFNSYLPRGTLPTQRWFFGGFLGGMWAFVARKQERGNFLYMTRLSIDSLYKVGTKRQWWKGMKNGDVLLFVASLALLEYVHERRPGAVRSSFVRKGLGMVSGEGWTDRVATSSAEAKEPQDREVEEEVLGDTVDERKGQ